MKQVAFLEFDGLVFDACFILEYELEDGRRAYLDKFDKYFYNSICNLLRNNGKSYIPFK